MMHVARSAAARAPRPAFSRHFGQRARPPHEVLGLGFSPTEDQIQAAFKKKAKRLHPDLVPEEERESATAAFKELEEARRKLLDVRKGSTSQGGAGAKPGDQQFHEAPRWAGGAEQMGSFRKQHEEREAQQQVEAADWWRQLQRLLGLIVATVLAWKIYDMETDRAVEKENEELFGQKKFMLRQKRAEQAKQEFEDRLTSAEGRRDAKIQAAEASAHNAFGHRESRDRRKAVLEAEGKL